MFICKKLKEEEEEEEVTCVSRRIRPPAEGERRSIGCLVLHFHSGRLLMCWSKIAYTPFIG